MLNLATLKIQFAAMHGRTQSLRYRKVMCIYIHTVLRIVIFLLIFVMQSKTRSLLYRLIKFYQYFD